MTGLVETKDTKGRIVRLHVHALQGAIVTVTRANRGDGGSSIITVALNPDECRELAAAFIKAAGDTVVR